MVNIVMLVEQQIVPAKMMEIAAVIMEHVYIYQIKIYVLVERQITPLHHPAQVFHLVPSFLHHRVLALHQVRHQVRHQAHHRVLAHHQVLALHRVHQLALHQRLNL